MEEMGDKLGSVVGGNMLRNSVLGEDMDDKGLGKFRGGDGVMGGDKFACLDRQSTIPGWCHSLKSWGVF